MKKNTMITMNNANETYRVINNNKRKWAVDEEGIIRSTMIPAVPASVTVQVQIQVPEKKAAAKPETAETAETAEKKITIYNEDGSINVSIIRKIKELNSEKGRVKTDIYTGKRIISEMEEKGFHQSINKYMENASLFKYDGRTMTYEQFISTINKYNDANKLISDSKEKLEKLEKELEKYEF